MAKLYYKKIVNGEINPETGAPWVLEDVPEKWREQVRQMLEQ